MSVPSADACEAFRLSFKKLLDSVVTAWDGSSSTVHSLRSYLEHGAGGIWLESWVAIPRRHRVRAGWLWSLHQSVASTGNCVHCFVCIFIGTTVSPLEAWSLPRRFGPVPTHPPFPSRSVSVPVYPLTICTVGFDEPIQASHIGAHASQCLRRADKKHSSRRPQSL